MGDMQVVIKFTDILNFIFNQSAMFLLFIFANYFLNYQNNSQDLKKTYVVFPL